MKRRDDTGTFSITSPGISERVEESSSSFGAAVSKAQNIATRLQRELKASDGEEDVKITVRRLDSTEVLAEVLVQRELIATWATA